MQLIKYLKSDLQRYFTLEGKKSCISFSNKLYIILFSYGLHASSVYRFGRYIDSTFDRPHFMLLKCFALTLYNCMNFIIKVAYDVRIHKNAVIGGGLYIGHFGGIRIGQCRLGQTCSLNHQVCIGDMATPAPNAGPIIGDNVWIGSYVKIGKNIIVGDNATIAAGSVVHGNVKSGTLIIGNPARVINTNYNNTFLL